MKGPNLPAKKNPQKYDQVVGISGSSGESPISPLTKLWFTTSPAEAEAVKVTVSPSFVRPDMLGCTSVGRNAQQPSC